jgi:hypothetical protein
MLGITEVIEAVKWNFVANNLFILGDDRCRWVCLASQGPNILTSKEEEPCFAAIYYSEVGIVGVDNLIIASSEEEEADFAL